MQRWQRVSNQADAKKMSTPSNPYYEKDRIFFYHWMTESPDLLPQELSLVFHQIKKGTKPSNSRSVDLAFPTHLLKQLLRYCIHLNYLLLCAKQICRLTGRICTILAFWPFWHGIVLIINMPRMSSFFKSWLSRLSVCCLYVVCIDVSPVDFCFSKLNG